MKEFGKKVQEENLKRTLLAKEAKKVCDALTQKKAEEERKKKEAEVGAEETGAVEGITDQDSTVGYATG